MRRYGAGSVFQRKDGKWIATWERPRGEDGRRRRGVRVADTQAKAQRAMTEARKDEGRSSSRSPRPTGRSVGEFLDEWLRTVVSRTRRERTLVGYQAIVSALPDELRVLDLRDARLAHAVQAFLNSLERHPRTVHHYAACLKAAFGYATAKKLMDANPAIGLDLPAIPRTERIPLTATQLRAFLASTVDHPLHGVFITAAWTGMRQGEVLALRWQDVDLRRASLVVRSSLSRLPGKDGTRYVIGETKTARSRRTVPLLPEVVAALEAIRRAQMSNPAKLDQGLVFCTPAGSPLDGTNVTHAFQSALAAAGLPRHTFHSLRHGAASMLIEAGVDLATVSSILGHSNIATTIDVYGHLTDAHRRTAIDRLADVG